MRLNPELSDLFFNMPHENLDNYYDLAAEYEGNPPANAESEALLLDAREFVSDYPTICEYFDGVTAEELVTDYLNRR